MATKTLAMTRGLITESGQWVRPEGSCSLASNVDLSSPGLVAKRRGFSSNTLNSFSGTVWGVLSSESIEFGVGAGGVILATGGNTTAGATGLSYGLRGSTFTGFTGTFAFPPRFRPRLTVGPDGKDVIAQRGDVTAADSGLIVVDSYAAGGLRRLGVPRGMGLDRQNTTLSGVSGFLSANSYARYAVIFVRGDPANNGAEFGAPGMTTVVENSTGASADVATRVLLPRLWGTTATALPADTYWVQVYRSAVTATSLGEPPSELALVYEQKIAAADIAAGYVAFTDSVPDSLRGADLYTNPLTGESGIERGFANSNHPPPIASDVALWADCLWAADIMDLPSQEVQLISVGGSGLVAADTVTVGGRTYTAVAAAPAAEQFVVVSGGTASYNQRETALNIVDAINRNTANNTSVWASYTAGQAGLPGRILLRGRIGTSSINASTSRAAAFRISTEYANQTTRNALAFSKSLQPSAWPVINRFEVGRGDAEILRVVPFRDSLLVFKTDGLWRITGTTFENFEVQEFDLTFKLLGPSLVATLDDAVYAWGTQGLARIDESGVELIGLPIRETVEGIRDAVSLTTLRDYAFAVGNQRDGTVAFFYPTTNPSGGFPVGCADALVWHARTGLWATWNFATGGSATVSYVCGVSNVLDGLVTLGVWETGTPSAGWIHNERRDYATTDFQDMDLRTSTSVTMTATSITGDLEWSPLSRESLGVSQWLRVRVEMAPATTTRVAPPATLNVRCYGDASSGAALSTAAGTAGSSNDVPLVYVAPVEQSASRAHGLQVRLSNATQSEGFSIVGVSIDYRPAGEKGAR